MNITKLIKGNITQFSRYRHQHLYYTIMDHVGNTYEYPIPLDDLQDATVENTEKAITLMRYIRKAIEEQTFVKVD